MIKFHNGAWQTNSSSDHVFLCVIRSNPEDLDDIYLDKNGELLCGLIAVMALGEARLKY